MRRALLAAAVPVVLVAGLALGSTQAVAQDPPEPVFTQDFSDEPAGDFAEGYTIADCGGDRGKCLEARNEPAPNGSTRLRYFEEIPPGEEYTLNYDLRFRDDFEWVRGGKLPGLAPETLSSGCSPIVPEGWSARNMWRAEGSLNGYTYHQDRESDCGDNVEFSDFRFESDQWYRMSLHVKVNSGPDTADGQITYYVDGRQVAAYDDVRLRGVGGDEGLIEQVLVETFHGGSDETWSPKEPTRINYDNFTVNPGRSVA